MKEAKLRNSNAKFYFYKLTNRKLSPIVWIDSLTLNQHVFSKHQYLDKTTNEITTLFHFPPDLSTLPQVICSLKFKGLFFESDDLFFQHVLPSTAAGAADSCRLPSPQGPHSPPMSLSPTSSTPQATASHSNQQVAKQFLFFNMLILMSFFYNVSEARQHWLCAERLCKTRSPP